MYLNYKHNKQGPHDIYILFIGHMYFLLYTYMLWLKANVKTSYVGFEESIFFKFVNVCFVILRLVTCSFETECIKKNDLMKCK